MSEMHTLDRTGHTSIRWDSENDAEIDNARAIFNMQRERGMRAFRTSASGKPAERMDTFDPEAESIVFVPHVAGG